MLPTNEDDDEAAEEEAWERMTADEFFRSYAESDSIYDDPIESDSDAQRPPETSYDKSP